MKKEKIISFPLKVFSFIIIIFIAFRYEVGGDWGTYKINYDIMGQAGLFDGLKSYTSKFPIFIVYFTKNLNVFTETVILGLIFSFFYIRYLFSTKLFFLSLFITFPVFVVLAGMGYVHQGVSIIISWQILINYNQKSVKEIIGYVIIASFVHLSALFFLFFLIPKFILQENLLSTFKATINKHFPTVIAVLVFLYILRIYPVESIYLDLYEKFNSYLFSDYYKSYGTIIRAFLFIPSAYIFFKIDLDFFKKKINLQSVYLIKTTAFVMLIIALLSILSKGSLLFAFVDRLYICLIFLQVMIANLYYEQYKLKDHIIVDLLIYLMPLGYLFLWVNFSKYAPWWVPYNNILFFQSQ
tara:strand:- start:1178 stop:2239 length:1062 start_codon:yes stop_codon:yes gene_type:complete